jgi:hypothetical protein
MGRQLLWPLVGQFREFKGLATRSIYPLINTINAGVDEVVEIFSRRSQMEPKMFLTTCS